ncbi:peptidase [Bremerella cremea]|uniref:Peptidase n=1 Tax=Bremerella cremea TaxID=1031537 RepID=A0A368KXL2_9BACT|nr:prolyl oligopeptidase family serine peptidase [Bremerella cremea]RCS55983.1 peptidase [Bremerella cremea]
MKHQPLALPQLLLGMLLLVVGCNQPDLLDPPEGKLSDLYPTLQDARAGFETKIVTDANVGNWLDQPPPSIFHVVNYQSPAGRLVAYLTPDPGDGEKHPAIVWITGGDNNAIGDVWTLPSRDNDQGATPFRREGIVMMFPAQRGGNGSSGKREGFYGEVDDILAATDFLAQQPYVDPDQIYLGGHSTGGTLAMLVGECSDRYRGIIALGPVASVVQYGGEYVYCDPNDTNEMQLRSPLYWLHCVKSPMFVFEGENQGNWDGSIEVMAKANTNPQIEFWKVPGHDHFSVIAPVAELLAPQIIQGKIEVTQQMVDAL